MTRRPQPSVEPVPRPTQVERKSEAERRLLTAAAELIGEVGPSEVTLAQIGERAGYSRGLATFHFGNKGALMQRLAAYVTDWFRDSLRTDDSVGRQSTQELLLALVGTYFDVITDLPPIHRARLVLMADAVAHPSTDVRPAMVEADRSFRASIAASIVRGIDAGEIDVAIDPVGFATALVGMLRGVAFQSMADDSIDLAASRAEVEQFLTARLRPRPVAARKRQAPRPTPKPAATPRPASRRHRA